MLRTCFYSTRVCPKIDLLGVYFNFHKEHELSRREVALNVLNVTLGHRESYARRQLRGIALGLSWLFQRCSQVAESFPVGPQRGGLWVRREHDRECWEGARAGKMHRLVETLLLLPPQATNVDTFLKFYQKRHKDACLCVGGCGLWLYGLESSRSPRKLICFC